MVESDGVHLTSSGATAVARLIRQAVVNHWGSSATSGGSNSASSSTASSSTDDDHPTLAYGSLGDRVEEVQRLLLAVGSSVLEPYGVTGRYFAVTQDAVRDFQSMVRDRHDEAMVVDGIVGDQTWRWLEQLADSGASGNSNSASADDDSDGSASSMTLSYGVLGPPVEELQRILLRIGSPTLEAYGVTGKFYAVTRRAVREFQQSVKDRYDSSMVVDGIVGSTTWYWLERLDPDD